jgi:hypothetical protein
MDTPLTPEARIELLRALRPRYQSSRSRTKKQILNEFVAATGYHKKYALHLLKASEVSPVAEVPRHRRRASLYDEAARKVLVEVWEVLDRSCGKIVKAAMPATLEALERHQHLTLDDVMRRQLLAMSAATIDRALRSARGVNGKRRRRVVPEIRRLVPVRTFGDWKDPPPGSMEMDLVAHCGEINRGSYLHTLVLTDIGSGWTECVALLVRDGGLVVNAVELIRLGLPFVLGALDVDNGSEFINEVLVEYCLKHHIELTRSRPYRKNDQAWIEQKNGDVVRRHVGYERLEGIAAHQTLSHLYEAVRLYQNFFQPSFKLAEKLRRGAQVTKRYLPPATPYERLLEAPNVPESSKEQLRALAVSLDPVKLIEQIHTLRVRLAVIAKGERPNTSLPQPPRQHTAFLTSVPVAPPVVTVRAAPVVEPPARDVHPQHIETVVPHAPMPSTRLPTQKSAAEPPLMRVLSGAKVIPFRPLPPDRPLAHGLDPEFAQRLQELRREFRAKHTKRPNAFMLVWPQICRRLEGKPNLSASELFDELCVQYPGRFHPGQLKVLTSRVVQWRKDAQARGLVIGRRTIRRNHCKPRGRTRPDPFQTHWPEMLQCLEAEPAQTALELLANFMARYPGLYQMGQLRTLQRRVKAWRRAELERLMHACGSPRHPQC